MSWCRVARHVCHAGDLIAFSNAFATPSIGVQDAVRLPCTISHVLVRLWQPTSRCYSLLMRPCRDDSSTDQAVNACREAVSNPCCCPLNRS